VSTERQDPQTGEGRRPLLPRALGPHDMPRIHLALSPDGVVAAAFSADELEAPGLRIVEYVPVRVSQPA
jgi:hypothetical protein